MSVSNTQKHKDFDKLKRKNARKWAKISVYDVKGQTTLIHDGFRCLIYASIRNHLDLDRILQKVIIRVNQFVKNLIIPENPLKNEVVGPLDEFISSSIKGDKDE